MQICTFNLIKRNKFEENIDFFIKKAEVKNEQKMKYNFFMIVAVLMLICFVIMQQWIRKIQIKQQPMQELFLLIKQRFDRVHQVTRNKLNNEQYREVRQQQKTRCQKQAWILSMFRSKKSNMTASMKNYQIMKIIDHDFQYEGEPNLSDQTFLNDFVCLYTKFFDNYEDKFQFKVKIRNLLRPTNHNVLNDMVKYLADFSRDYSQHVYLWQLKEVKKQQQAAEESQKRLSMSGNNSQSVMYPSIVQINNQSESSSKEKPMQSFRNSVNIGHIGETAFKKSNQDNETELLIKKNQFQKIYGMLQIQPLPNFVFMEKTKSNIEVLRLRMNQLYRDAKYRNNMVKSSITLYLNSYHAKYNPGNLGAHLNKQNLIQDAHPHISHPYRVSLVIQRNGFSCINITTHDHERNLSPVKDKIRLSSLSNRDSGLSQLASKTSKNQFVLNSLKVLRVSQNFLPPLIGKKQSTRVNSEEQIIKQEIALKKLSYSNTQNIINLQVEGARQMDQVSHNGVIYYNQQLLREAERRKNQKKKLSQLRKHFTSEQKTKMKGGKKNDPQQKIVEWLDKINMMKQLERKKILGLG